MHAPLVSRVPSTGAGLSYTVLSRAAFRTLPTDGSCLVHAVAVVDCRENQSSARYGCLLMCQPVCDSRGSISVCRCKARIVVDCSHSFFMTLRPLQVGK